MARFVDLSAIREAADRIRPYVRRTPVMQSSQFDARVGARVFFKCENFQKVGAFKFRGATNAVLSLSPAEATRGVVTHSSGNHAQALSAAARIRDISATIVMPRDAPAVKRNAVEAYGGKIVFCEPTLAAREQTTAQVMDQTGATLVHPYNDRRIIAGQGTAALELVEEVGSLDFVLTPVGGGGLLSGTSIVAAELKPNVKVIGAEPAGADDAYRSLEAGRLIPVENPNTVADGLRTSLGDLTFSIIQKRVDQIITVDDSQIVEAMKYIWERMKLVIEPSAAVPVAVLIRHTRIFSGKRVGLILSGGNVDLDRLPWIDLKPSHTR